MGDAGILKLRADGQPVVVLAQIFQNSPSILITKRDIDIFSPYELAGKTVMLPECVWAQDRSGQWLGKITQSHNRCEDLGKAEPGEYKLTIVFESNAKGTGHSVWNWSDGYYQCGGRFKFELTLIRE